MRIGAHQSISGGFTTPLESISAKGGNALQIFASSPRFWTQPDVSDEVALEFVQKKEELDIDPIYFHACYLINLANTEKGGYASVSTLTKELKLASRMHIRGSIIHLGSFTNGTYEKLIPNIQKVIQDTPEDTVFIAENAGTRKIGTTLEELGKIVKDVDSDRLKICLDTCHLHAAGYDLSTKKSFEDFFMQFDKLIGMEKLEVIHVNDSRDPFGSNRDRHENLGEGMIPSMVFDQIVNNPLTKEIPCILETPGFDKKGPDKKNIDILKSFVK
jgi:apurinic endonuclease APN1